MSLNKKFSSNGKKCTVLFKLEKAIAPQAKDIRILGDFNNWNWNQGIVMRSSGDSYAIEVELQVGRVYEYRYLIDRQRWENDVYADAYHPSPYDGINNCVVDLISVPETKQKVAKKSIKRRDKAPDLTLIEGIGPKIKGLLNDGGIISFSDLAGSGVAQLRGILIAAGSRYKMHDPTTWPEQAALAAAEKWEELKILQKELKGGRR